MFSWLDTVLDRTVVLGYTRVGYSLRERTFKPTGMPPMDGKVVLVTGASSGLGLAAAEGFARLGATVHLLARDERRGELAREQIAAQSGNGEVQLDLCDLADLDSVRRYAQRLHAQTPRLDVLVNNAGALPHERTVSADGIELTFATNVVGPFLLTNLLVESLAASDPGRIVNVSSGGMYTQRVHLDDLQMARERFDGATAYARSKRAEAMLTEEWARRLPSNSPSTTNSHARSCTSCSSRLSPAARSRAIARAESPEERISGRRGFSSSALRSQLCISPPYSAPRRKSASTRA